MQKKGGKAGDSPEVAGLTLWLLLLLNESKSKSSKCGSNYQANPQKIHCFYLFAWFHFYDSKAFFMTPPSYKKHYITSCKKKYKV